jgi:diguanylate cyclase (GGDEF)-like protein
VDRTSLESVLFRPQHWIWIAGALAAVVAVGYVDYLTGPEITFSVFYLVPVAIAAWLGGTTVGIVASALAAIVWYSAEVATSRLNANPFVYAWNFGARLIFLLLVALLLAQLRQMLRRERELSRTDSLTGLPNARAFREVARGEIARCQRYGHALSLAFIDIDDFKRVNDSRGHGAGDDLLKRAGEAIRGNLRSSDFVARYGGDEFVVLLPTADENAARLAVDKLRARMREAMAKEVVPVALSIGVVTYTPGGSGATVDAMLEIADRLMYEVKAVGKGAARFANLGP